LLKALQTATGFTYAKNAFAAANGDVFELAGASIARK